MKNNSVYELEKRVRRKPNEFINLILEILKTDGLEAAIKIIKRSGICISILEKNKHESLLKTILKVFKEKYPGRFEIKELEEQINIFNKIITRFHESKIEFNKSVIQETDQLVPFLLAIENLFGRFYLEHEGVSEEEINNIYPFKMNLLPVTQKYEDSNLGRETFEKDRNSIYEIMAVNVHIIVRELIKKSQEIISNKNFDLARILTISEWYFEYADKREMLEDLIDKWKYLDAKLIFRDEKAFYVEMPNFGQFKEFLLSNFRHRSIRENFAIK